jgi:hypothetical protein
MAQHEASEMGQPAVHDKRTQIYGFEVGGPQTPIVSLESLFEPSHEKGKGNFKFR